MNTHADKIQKNESRSAANTASHHQGGDASTFQVVDNPAEAIQMRNLQEMADNSPQTSQLRAFQEMANDSPQAKHVAQLQLMANDYAARQQQPIRQRASKDGLAGFADEGSSIDSGMVTGRTQGGTPAPEKHIEAKGQPVQRVVRIGKKKLTSRKNISQLWRADEIDEHLGLGPKKKEKFQSELRLLAEGKNITEFPGWDEAYLRLRNPKILIKGDDGVVSIIKNTTDLMLWLGSYPLSSEVQPRGYAQTETLQRALDSLKELKKTITNKKVWQEVALAAETEPSDDEPENKWGNLELVDSVDMFGKPDKENQLPGRYKRKLPPDEYEKKLQELRRSLAGYKLVGLHATTMESTGPLVKEGVSQARFATGHGVGKGKGFYIIPAQRITDNLIKNTKAWGNHVLAVFLPKSAEQAWATGGDNVQTLEEENVERKPLYYMFGDLEAVIPPSLCPKVKIVVDPADISMGNTQYEAERYDDEFSFMKSL